MKRPYTAGRMWLNLVMKACLSQSTKHSEIRTIKAGEKMVWRSERVGRDGRERDREEGNNDRREGEDDVEESSIRLRRAMMKSMMPNWKRSTMSVRYRCGSAWAGDKLVGERPYRRR